MSDNKEKMAGIDLEPEILRDDDKFMTWLKAQVQNDVINKAYAKLLKTLREKSMGIFEKIERGVLPEDYFKRVGEPPFDPDGDPYDGTYECPHDQCNNHNGKRTGWIRKTDTIPYGDEMKEVKVSERCKCHPGYKKYGPK